MSEWVGGWVGGWVGRTAVSARWVSRLDRRLVCSLINSLAKTYHNNSSTTGMIKIALTMQNLEKLLQPDKIYFETGKKDKK